MGILAATAKYFPAGWHRIAALVVLSIIVTGVWVMTRTGTQQESTEELDPAKQQFIWDSEHITFKIERRFGKLFKAALASGNRPHLLSLFQESFRAQNVEWQGAPSTVKTVSHGSLIQTLRTGGGGTDPTVGADGLVDHLLSWTQTLTRIDRLGFRVLKISQAAATGQQKWNTTILISLFGIDANHGLIALDSQHAVQFRFQDEAEIDGGRVVDSWQILWEKSRTAPQMMMEEVTAESGLSKIPLQDNWLLSDQEPQQFRFQMAVEDFDRDGFLDIAVASGRGFPLLLKSVAGKRFVDVSWEMGFPTWSPRLVQYLANWIDYDNDGFPDLILGDRLYRNINGERFEDITEESGLKFLPRPMGCTVADFNRDGRLDLYVSYQFSGQHLDSDPGQGTGAIPWIGDDRWGQENHLWLNAGNGRFREVAATSGAGAGRRNSFATACLYADDDEFPDLYVANDFGQNVLLRNRGDGTFEDISAKTLVADFATSMGVATGDLDNDGSPEIYVANMYSKMGRRIIAQVTDSDYSPGIYEQLTGSCAGNRLYRRLKKSGSYQELSTPLGINGVGWAYAPAMVDLDNDGRLDLYATAGFMSFDRHKPDG